MGLSVGSIPKSCYYLEAQTIYVDLKTRYDSNLLYLQFLPCCNFIFIFLDDLNRLSYGKQNKL